jgi:mRNA interferase RelE/StbE
VIGEHHYTVRIDEDAERQLAKIPKRMASRVSEKIVALGIEPRPHGVVKMSGIRNMFRIRVGDYRVVYSIFDRELVVLVIRIGARKDVYRNL